MLGFVHQEELEFLMKTKLLLATFVLAVTPGLAMAMSFGCSGDHKEQITMSCPEGQAFDAETQSCKPPATG